MVATVFVIDDNPAVLDIARDALTGAGYRVVTAEDGAQAVDVFGKRHDEFDLVLLDVILPRLHGSEVLRACQRIDRTVPVVIMSGFVRDTGVDELLAEGGRAFIAKPFAITEVLHLVDTHRRR